MDLTELYFRKKKRQLEKITDFNVLFSVLGGAIVLIILIFAFAFYSGKVLDPEISVVPIPEKQLAALAPVTVETGILVHEYPKFDMLKDSFIAKAIVWFHFNPSTVDPALVDKFNFEKGSLLSKVKFREQKSGDKLLLLYEIVLDFKGFFDYSHFPLDKHRLDFILINPAASPEQLVYVTKPDLVDMDKRAFTEGWSLVGKSSQFGYAQEALQVSSKKISFPYERTIFSFVFEHSSLKEAIIIFLPLFLMFMVGLLSLLLDMVFESRVIIELAVGATLSLVFISNYIRSFTPLTGIFTLVDVFYILLMVITSVIFMTQIFTLHCYRKKQSETQLKEVLDFTVSKLNIFRCLVFLWAVFAFVFFSFYILVIR